MLEGHTGEPISTKETEGVMARRVLPDLLGIKNIMVLNDEAHHCYRAKPPDADEEADLSGEEKEEAAKNNDTARLWISGIESIKRTLGVGRIYDLSATPFFLRGSGYLLLYLKIHRHILVLFLILVFLLPHIVHKINPKYNNNQINLD